MSQGSTQAPSPPDEKQPSANPGALAPPSGPAPSVAPPALNPISVPAASSDVPTAPAPPCARCSERPVEPPAVGKWLLIAWSALLAIGPAACFVIGRAFRGGYFYQLGMLEGDFPLSWPEYAYTGFNVSFYIAQSVVDLVSPEIQLAWIGSICLVALAGTFSLYAGYRRRSRQRVRPARSTYAPSPGFRSSMALTFVGMLFVFTPVLLTGVLFSVALVPHLAEREGIRQAGEVLKALNDPVRSRRFPFAVLPGETGAPRYRAIEASSAQYLARDEKGLVILKRERVVELRSSTEAKN